jgi:hypothetical protein
LVLVALELPLELVQMALVLRYLGQHQTAVAVAVLMEQIMVLVEAVDQAVVLLGRM